MDHRATREGRIEGKMVVMTGATSGIGRIAAERLAAAGARLIVVARNRGRAEPTLAALRACGPAASHQVRYADLSRLAEVRRVGAEIAAAEPRIDVLINNAGAIFGRRRLTEDGLERTFAVNHMASFVLTHALRERLFAAAPARVVNTASAAHAQADLDFGDLQCANGYHGFAAYARSKLCNVLFTRELARRWAGSGVTANCLHPGFVATRLGAREFDLLTLGVRVAMLFAGSPDKGAETITYLARAPDVSALSGGYFVGCRLVMPSAAAQDNAAAERLWAESARLAGLA